jgi:citrate lyase beta subunit
LIFAGVMMRSIAASLRALLFMPGGDRRKIEKASALSVDAIIMDLEDGVALNRKLEARQSVATALQEVDFGSVLRLVRINGLHSDFWRDDLAALRTNPPDMIVIPKTESAAQVQAVAREMDDLPLLAIIESGAGVLALDAIAQADRRLAGLVFGAEDYAGDIGAVRTLAGEEVLYARSAVVLHAKARRLAAIDTPFIHLQDDEGLKADSERALRLGFTGKLAIHPRQLAVIHAAFTPMMEEIRQAKRLMAAHNAHQSGGTGVFAFDGKMVDMPLVRAAEGVLARAVRAGIDVDAV